MWECGGSGQMPFISAGMKPTYHRQVLSFGQQLKGSIGVLTFMVNQLHQGECSLKTNHPTFKGEVAVKSPIRKPDLRQ